MRSRFRVFNDFIELFYPRLCLACERQSPPRNHIICIPCQHFLPKTKFHLERENPFTEHFWGRIPIDAGAALYHFTKSSKTQHLVHQLKYKGKWQVGVKLGQMYGSALKNSPYFNMVEIIIPVPLHPRKEKIRGYNQSAQFAKGLSETMRIPWSNDALIRNAMTETQTNKSRMERFENVAAAFVVKNENQIKGKHLLLVDDVMTTGATLEACAVQLLKVEGVKVSLATIAMGTSL